MASISVSVVDGDPEMCERISAVLRDWPGLRCLGSYESGEELVRHAEVQEPDVILAGTSLPGSRAIACVAALKLRAPGIEVLVLADGGELELIGEMLRAGANGCVMKNASAFELVEAVRQIHAGRSPMPVQILRHLVNSPPGSASPRGLSKLSVRERETLELLAEGFFYREISERLGISVATVRSHLHSVYEKLEVRTRSQAALKYFELLAAAVSPNPQRI